MLSVLKKLHLIRDWGDALIHTESGHAEITKSVILGLVTIILL